MWAKYMFAGRNMNNTLFKWRAAKRSLQTELINEECDNYLIEHEDISLNNDHEINFENFSADEAEENEENNLADELTEKQNIWNFENNSVLTFNYLDGATLFVLRHKKNDALKIVMILFIGEQPLLGGVSQQKTLVINDILKINYIYLTS